MVAPSLQFVQTTGGGITLIDSWFVPLPEHNKSSCHLWFLLTLSSAHTPNPANYGPSVPKTIFPPFFSSWLSRILLTSRLLVSFPAFPLHPRSPLPKPASISRFPQLLVRARLRWLAAPEMDEVSGQHRTQRYPHVAAPVAKIPTACHTPAGLVTSLHRSPLAPLFCLKPRSL